MATCRLCKDVSVEMRHAPKAARRIYRMLPKIERAGATFFEFVFWGGDGHTTVLAQILDGTDADVRLPTKLGKRLLKAAKQLMPPGWRKDAAVHGILTWSLKEELIQFRVSWEYRQDWPLSADARRRLTCDDDAKHYGDYD